MMRRSPRMCPTAGLIPSCLLMSVGTIAATRAASLPAGFTEFAIAQRMSDVTAMEFSPDGKLFVLEQAGTIEVYQGGGATAWTRLQPNFLADVPIIVDGQFERGMLGIAFDPDYAQNRFVYLYYTTVSPVHNRVIRVTANATGDLAIAGSLTPIIDLEDLTAPIHNGGAIHFGGDGRLYVAVGENGETSNSQSINNRLGKMLRLDVDNPPTYIAADNPTSIAGIPGITTGANRAIWAAGLRNPFTFAFKPGTNLMYINDVGGGLWEEVNVGVAGANYGWSITEGPFNQLTFPNFTHPVIAYQHVGGGGNYPPGSPIYTGTVISGGAFYSPPTPTFPSEYADDYFYADAGAGFIRRYKASNKTVLDFATNAGSPVDLKVGNDGALYYLARDSGRVFRIAPCIANIVNAGPSAGMVDIDDLLAVISAWGPCPTPPAACPENIATGPGSETVVNIDDVLAVISAWGSCP